MVTIDIKITTNITEEKYFWAYQTFSQIKSESFIIHRYSSFFTLTSYILEKYFKDKLTT